MCIRDSFIRADEIWCYVTEQMCQYSKAIEYFQCENSYAFWQKYEDDFKTNWINKYKERNQRYYGKKKIQKSKTLIQIADELEEEPDTIQSLYECVSQNINLATEEIYKIYISPDKTED